MLSRSTESSIGADIRFPRFLTVVEDVLIGADSSGIWAFDLSHRHLKWKVAGHFSGAPAAFDEQLQSIYASHSIGGQGHNGSLQAFDLRTGELMWEVGEAEGLEVFPSAPLVLENHVYMAIWSSKQEEEEGEFLICAFDTQTGQETWRYTEHGGGPSTGLAASQGKLYYGRRSLEGTDKRICALDIASQQLLWTVAADEEMRWAPVLADSVLYAATAGGALHAFDGTTGAPLWTFAAPQAFECFGDLEMPCSPCCIAEHMVFFQVADTVYALH